MMTDDTRAMAQELSGMLRAGAADPMALLAGRWAFHSCFLAPFTPAFAAAREQFLVDGGGPLSATVDQLRHQGLSAAEASETARRLMSAAQGLCVAVVAGDHGVATVPQPFFGSLDAAWREGAAQVLAADFRSGFAEALAELAAVSGRAWPRLVAGPALNGKDLRGYWTDLAHGAADYVELTGHRGDARLADLGYWIGEAVTVLAPDDLDAEDHAALCRCRLVAGGFRAACDHIAACAQASDGDGAPDLLDALAAAVAQAGGDQATAAWLAGAHGLTCAYDVALARVRIVAAGGGDAGQLAPAVDALVAANRKLARQALTREPLWQVTSSDPGELLDTAAAANLLGRSPTAIAKRLEARTIPLHARDGQIRIPRRALDAWREALGKHGLIDV